MLAAIFFMAAVGDKIPNFDGAVGYMTSNGVPQPKIMLAGAIVFLVVGSVSVIAGWKTRIGASLLLAFLVLATYYFHPFWKVAPDQVQMQTIQFMKNVSMMGAMLLLIANGPGPMSVDRNS
jgi:putative oxidoreductase